MRIPSAKTAAQRTGGLGCALLLALSLAGVPATGASAAPALVAEDPSADPLSAQIAETTGQLQTDLSSMREAQDAAEERYAEARAKARELRAVVARNSAAAQRARMIVGQYARSIYMSGSTDLSLLASMIDPASPDDLVNRADDALRVGDHKDLEYDRAVETLKRNQEVEEQAQLAESAAEASLTSIQNQINGLHRQLADVAGKWADHLAGLTNTIDTRQARLNSEAAAQWAEYLGSLADLRAPSISELDLRSGRLPKGVKSSRTNPGIGTFRAGDDTLTLVPERVVAAVTYAVSMLGTPYKWQRNSTAEMDCSSLVDRAWNVPTIPRAKREDVRPLVPNGVAGIASRTRLVPTSKLNIGDVVFLTDPRRGVHHAGVVLDSDTMIASDAHTGGVNAVPIPTARIWQVGRLSLKPPRTGNFVPKATKKPFQCGADPAGFITMPDGRILANPALCPPNPGVFGEAHMQPAAIAVGRCASALWPAIQIIGGWRPADAYPDHPSGRAVDIMMPAGCAADAANVGIGNGVATFYMRNAAKFNVKYIIWQQRVWMAGETPIPTVQWRGMSDRGSCTANHMDHVHVTVNGPDVAPGVTTSTTPDSSSDDTSSDDTKVDTKTRNEAGQVDEGRGDSGKDTQRPPADNPKPQPSAPSR